MEVIPVADLLGRKAVRAVGGRRREYRPWNLPHLADDSLAAMARYYRGRFGFSTLYLADLDALGGAPSPDWAALEPLLAEGWSILLDAGLHSPRQLAAWLAAAPQGGSGIEWVAPLEGFSCAAAAGDGAEKTAETLRRCLDLVGPGRLTFSLDLHDGRPLFAGWNAGPSGAATETAEDGRKRLEETVAAAADAGVRRWIVLDLASVGSRDGGRADDALRWMRGLPGVQRLTGGGGVRGPRDLDRLRTVGCDAALVATALHEGGIAPADVG